MGFHSSSGLTSLKTATHGIQEAIRVSINDTVKFTTKNLAAFVLGSSCGTLASSLVPEVFHEAATKTSSISGTESHFHAVDSCQICHLSNYTINQSPRCYHDSSNQEQGSDSDPT